VTDAHGERPAPSILRWAFALGATGFSCGFFGPIALAPDANQGPLLGIFISGPGGALLGLLLGLACRVLPLSPRQRRRALQVACATLALATLYFATPEPAYRGEIVDGEVRGCTSPAALADEAIQSWEREIAKVTWGKPRPGWKQDAQRRLSQDHGLVLELHVLRTRRVYENQKPWNEGSIAARPWTGKDESKQFYVGAAAGASCDTYLQRGRGFYYPTSAADSNWPPIELANFLGLMVLGPVPDRYQELAGS
jgi:hypothetical protein